MNRLVPIVIVLSAALAGCSAGSGESSEVETAATPAEIHERLLTLDTHLDTPLHFSRRGWSMGDRHEYATDVSEVDLPRMADGGLDGGFFVIYTAQGPLTSQGYADALEAATRRQREIIDMANDNSDRIALALTAEDAARIHAEGRAFAYQSIENSYPLGENVGRLQAFFDQGVRMAGPVHSADNQFSDSATGNGRWGGLSPLGRELIAEMNRLGIVVDASHASDAAFDDIMEISATPIILSHSGPKAAADDHPRNIDDDRIRALAAAGGVIAVNSIYLAPRDNGPAWQAMNARFAEFRTMSPEDQQALTRELRAFEAENPREDAGFDDFMRSLLHLIEVAGVDHVAFGADWDGGGGLPGMQDITAIPLITERLLEEGFSEEDLQKMWSGNVLRLLRRAEDHAASRR